MRNKIKAAVCCVCVFVVTFMLTVTAFADYIVANGNFIGKYTATDGLIPGYILVNTDNVQLFAYEDDDYLCFFTGTSDSAKLSNSPRYNFFADFERANRVTLDGSPAYGGGYVSGYHATGDIDITYGFLWTVKKVTIISNQSSHKYAHNT